MDEPHEVYKVPSVHHVPSDESWDTLRKEDPRYAGLAIHWRLEAEKERCVHAIGGVGAPDRTLCTNAADVYTTCTAILERMIYAKVSGRLIRRRMETYAYYDAILGEFKRRVVRAVGKVCSPVDPQEFVDSYHGRKRTIYQNNLSEYLDAGVKKCHSLLVMFMKVEKVNTTKSPRGIQPRHPVYNIGLGRYLKHMEKPIFRAIAKVFGQKYTVLKGLNANDMGEEIHRMWSKFEHPVAVGLDASRFDASVDEGLLRWEHSLYNCLFRSKELKRLLNMQLHNTGTAYCHDGKIKYHMSGGRGSGDMNTSLGNSLIMCGIIWEWLRLCGVKAELANNGDDCVVIMEKVDLSRFSGGFDEFALKCGFTMTIEKPVYHLEEIEFCQTHPIFMGDGWRMVRNYNTAREKDSLCMFPLDTPGAMESWLYAVGECGLALTGGVPVFQEFYSCYMRNGKPSKMGEAVFMQSGSRMMSVGMEAKRADILADTRVSFYKAFGVTPDEQVAMEEYYAAVTIRHKVNICEDIQMIPNAVM